MTDFTIRPYRPSDRPDCRDLWHILTERHRELYADPDLGGPEPGLAFDPYAARTDLAALWVAEAPGEDHAVGMCGLLLDGDEAEVEPIVVRPPWRRHGLGALLLATAQAEARARGLRFLNIRPVGRNASAIRLFHRAGFRLLGRVELSIPLEAPLAGEGPVQQLHGVQLDT